MKFLIGALAACILATQACAAESQATAPTHSYEIGTLTIEQPWSRETPGGAKVAGGYLRITNHGAEADRLTGGSTPIAGRVEIHEMTTEDGLMKMRPQPQGVEIPPGQTVEFKPGGYHLMFVDLKTPIKKGEDFKATLQFEKAGPVDVEFSVGGIAGAPAGDHDHMGQH
ncbi:MAG TPA: copper chaperone PCu(A)C [Beijerinckia sp.]|jgi:copper(I)-binding protein|nr:copper chaperone PCu(A)C [Beijerinckia sp.]